MLPIQGKVAWRNIHDTVEGAETEESIAERFNEVYEAF